jgi:RNase H-like domain found in reverse transcriptase
LHVVRDFRKFSTNIKDEVLGPPSVDELSNIVVCNKVASNSLANLKKEIVKQHRLAHFKKMVPSKIFCEATGLSLGATPSQIQPNSESRVRQYMSRTLIVVKQQYSHTQRELLAMVWSVTKKFRFYSNYRKKMLYTNYKALISKIKLTAESKRIVQLLLKLAQFDLTIEHKAETSMNATGHLAAV